MSSDELYEIYNRILGRVRSGAQIKNVDYGTSTIDGWVEYGLDGKTAVTIGVEDAKTQVPDTKTRSQLADEVKRRLA